MSSAALPSARAEVVPRTPWQNFAALQSLLAFLKKRGYHGPPPPLLFVNDSAKAGQWQAAQWQYASSGLRSKYRRMLVELACSSELQLGHIHGGSEAEKLKKRALAALESITGSKQYSKRWLRLLFEWYRHDLLKPHHHALAERCALLMSTSSYSTPSTLAGAKRQLSSADALPTKKQRTQRTIDNIVVEEGGAVVQVNLAHTTSSTTSSSSPTSSAPSPSFSAPSPSFSVPSTSASPSSSSSSSSRPSSSSVKPQSMEEALTEVQAAHAVLVTVAAEKRRELERKAEAVEKNAAEVARREEVIEDREKEAKKAADEARAMREAALKATQLAEKQVQKAVERDEEVQKKFAEVKSREEKLQSREQKLLVLIDGAPSRAWDDGYPAEMKQKLRDHPSYHTITRLDPSIREDVALGLQYASLRIDQPISVQQGTVLSWTFETYVPPLLCSVTLSCTYHKNHPSVAAVWKVTPTTSTTAAVTSLQQPSNGCRGLDPAAVRQHLCEKMGAEVWRLQQPMSRPPSPCTFLLSCYTYWWLQCGRIRATAVQPSSSTVSSASTSATAAPAGSNRRPAVLTEPQIECSSSTRAVQSPPPPSSSITSVAADGEGAGQ